MLINYLYNFPLNTVEMELFLKKYLYFHGNDTYCIINNDIKETYTEGSID